MVNDDGAIELYSGRYVDEDGGLGEGVVEHREVVGGIV